MKSAINNDAATHARAVRGRAQGGLHRTTIALPQPLLDEALKFGQRDGLPSLNAVVSAALEEYTERRRRDAFAEAIADMGHDPDIVRESDEINDLFAVADGDGIL
jgi:hypothetical protein